MVIHTKVLGIVPGLMAVSLATRALPRNLMAHKNMRMSKPMRKAMPLYRSTPKPTLRAMPKLNGQKQIKNIIVGGAVLLVGIPLLGSVVSSIGS